MVRRPPASILCARQLCMPLAACAGGAPRTLPCAPTRRPCASGAAALGRAALLVAAAKKAGGGGGKGKGGKGPKQSSLAQLLEKKKQATEAEGTTGGAAPRATPAQYASLESRMLAFQLTDSYWRLTKKYLLEGVDFEVLPAALYRAPFVLLAHNKFQPGVKDPLFTYANRAALELWDTTWDELIGTPSRKSAAEGGGTQQDRQALLDKAADEGYVTGYEGWRVSVTGKRFKIVDVTLFNVLDRKGTKLGQAAVFDRYQLEDGTVVQVAGTLAPDAGEEEALAAAAAASLPSPEDIQAAEAAVAEQAALVRSLKEEKGLTNQDIPVQLAVVELKARKEHLADMQKRLADALAASEAAFDDDGEEGEGDA